MRLRGPALVVLASTLSIQVAEPTFPSKRVGWDGADFHAPEAYDLGDTIDVFCLECHDGRWGGSISRPWRAIRAILRWTPISSSGSGID